MTQSPDRTQSNASRTQSTARTTRPDHAPVARSGHARCGLQVTAERRFKSGKWRVYYHCSDPYGRCTKRGINEADLEDEILGRLERVTVDAGVCEIALANIERWQGGRDRGAEAVLAGQGERLRSVERQRGRLLTMMLSGLLTDEAVYRAKEAELLAERNGLQLAMEKTREDSERVQAQARSGFHFAGTAREAFLMAPPQRKREIARALGTRYVLTERQLSVTLHPLLKEVVNYADEIMAKLEPGVRGNESRYRASFSASFSFGRGTRPEFEPMTALEPPSTLTEALREANFPVLQFGQGNA